MSSFRSLYPSVRVIAPTILLLVVTATAVAQSPASSAENTDRDVVMSRIERARALAAAHQLDAAATELESVRAAARDVVERNISTLMLIGIYLEEGNYIRPVALLDEAFQQRASKKDESIRAYFAVAGQVINGVRMRLARYRSFGINVNATDLPPEALKDLDQVRFLLERLVAQANEATNEKGRAYDAWALKEDVLGLRVSIARDAEDRDKWQSEHAAAREKLASRQIQIASIGRPPALEAVTAKLPNPFTGPKPAGSPEPSSINNNSTSIVPTPETKTAPPSRQPASNVPAASGGADTSSSSSPSSQPSDPETVTTGSLSGREIKRVRPQYPRVAKTSGVAGTVRVFVVLDEKGAVTVKGSEGPILLKPAAEEAARGWSFPPTRINNKPVRLSGYIDFEFKL